MFWKIRSSSGVMAGQFSKVTNLEHDRKRGKGEEEKESKIRKYKLADAKKTQTKITDVDKVVFKHTKSNISKK